MIRLLARAWLPVKAHISRWIARRSPRSPLPAFRSPGELAAYMRQRLEYVADPLGGALDYYTHPETVQHQIEHGGWHSQDCDDHAVYAYLALSRMPGIRPRLVTLVDARITMSHVVCAFRTEGGGFGVIDTNGLRFWAATIKPEDEDRLLVERFGGLYRCTYVAALTTPYPFKD